MYSDTFTMFSHGLRKKPGSSSVKLPNPTIFFSLVNRAFHVWPMLCSAHCGVKSTAIGIPALRILIIVIWTVSEQDLNFICFQDDNYVMPKQEYNED